MYCVICVKTLYNIASEDFLSCAQYSLWSTKVKTKFVCITRNRSIELWILFYIQTVITTKMTDVCTCQNAQTNSKANANSSHVDVYNNY